MAIENEETPWSEALITICEKCARTLPDLKLTEEGNASENLKKYLKGRFKQTEPLRRMRVVTTSCLDVCVKNTVAVSYNPVGAVKPQKTVTVHPEEDREALFVLLSGNDSSAPNK